MLVSFLSASLASSVATAGVDNLFVSLPFSIFGFLPPSASPTPSLLSADATVANLARASSVCEAIIVAVMGRVA